VKSTSTTCWNGGKDMAPEQRRKIKEKGKRAGAPTAASVAGPRTTRTPADRV
jgi:hypothetical protein